VDDDTRAAWLKWRREGIGGSEIAAVCGLSPWQSPLGVYLRKRRELPDDAPPTEAMRLGLALEDVVADEFHLRTGLHVIGAQTWCTHPELSWARVTVDGFAVESPHATRDDALGVYEAKTTGDSSRFDPLPDDVALQVQWQLFVTGLLHAWVAVLGGGPRGLSVDVKEVHRDDAAIEPMVHTAAAFWQSVQDGTPPAVTLYARGDADDLAAAYPVPEAGEAVELDDEGAELVEQLRALRKAGDVNAKRITRTENALKALMKTAEVATVDGVAAITWKQVDGTRIDTTALKERAPDVAARFAIPLCYRRFVVK
jgi:putative phage-type endonuclease